jgi:hypothetical protein
MKKFEIYDNVLEKWQPNGLLKTDGDVASSNSEYYQVCWGIEKTDITGKEIYADSSIVVFTFLDNKLREHEVIGYFYFNDTDLGYWIEMIDQAGVKYNHTRFYANRVKDLKIIDTIQENKLGLIGKENGKK